MPGANDQERVRLAAGDFEAVFLPRLGMLGASLRYRGIEFLRRVEDLADAARTGSAAGIPLLHPWANRLATAGYDACGREVRIDTSSPLLHRDENGLLIHGVPWSRLAWTVTDMRRDRLAARLDWTDAALLALFPFPHRLDLAATLGPDGLTIDTTLTAGSEGPVPVSFGFHPYVGLPGLPRAEWRLALPAMRRLALDDRHVPTGEEGAFDGFDAAMGEIDLDDGFATLGEQTSLVVSGAGHRISVDLLAGYRYAQVYAPRGRDLVALEPMTAPTNALASGRGLHCVQPGQAYRATFRIRIAEN